MKLKKLLYLVCLMMLIVLVLELADTYALFESKTNQIVKTDIGKWTVTVNDSSVTSGTFTVDTVNITSSENVKEGKIAPGGTGYFDIIINPKDTSVSLRCDITFDFSAFSGNISVSNIEEVNEKNLIMTGENTYTCIITLKEIENKETSTIRVYIKWENKEEANEEDSAIGTAKDNYLSIPVNVLVTQYLGEEIQAYTKEE